MSGIQTKLKDLGKSFGKFQKATLAEEQRKQAMINEFKNAFIRQGCSPWMAANLAEEKYKQLHK